MPVQNAPQAHFGPAPPPAFCEDTYVLMMSWIKEHARRLVYTLIAAALLFWLLKGCIPGLGGSLLPEDVLSSIEHDHIVCISPSDTPIWPGEPRQPECGQVSVKTIARGVVPAQAASQLGVSQAVCYTVTIQNPYWNTQGATRHEVDWQTHTFNKVAIYQNEAWQISPDREDVDAQMWADYACPANP
jgi:hypothetical protein